MDARQSPAADRHHRRLRRLTDHQLDAVLTHERGHARARHDWLLHLSSALATGFPRVPLFAHFCDQTHRLVELAADDTASAAAAT